ncbi:EamA family transporter [uncultured Actinomyces sp.]|uniref:EamA family transporter n=1 Tax=uncultured Actinomyces sp. TaxID=249061 RepID=UPI002804BBCB|nr:EamA family transporter [uncultured Actinomyces sp.]
MSPTDPAARQRATLLVLATYLIWGAFPLYFKLLAAAGALEVIGYRIVFTAATCLVLVSVTRSWPKVAAVLRSPRQLGTFIASGLLITLNWLTYVYGVNSGHAADAALGYFINPLVTVALAAAVLGERLRRCQGGCHRAGGPGGGGHGRDAGHPALDLPGSGADLRAVRAGQARGHG